MQVDFYILQNTESCELFACRLTEKAFNNGHKIYVHTDSAEQARLVNDMLWTFRQNNFIPHELLEPTSTQAVSGTSNNLCPVLISWGHNPNKESDILLNLSQAVPDFYEQFSRIIEVVNQEEKIKNPGRQRFAYYREQNCDLRHHDI